MNDIKRDIDFTVNVGDAIVSAAGFGTLGIFAPHILSPSRVLPFSSIDEVALTFPSDDPVFLAAQAAFAQKSEAGSLRTLKVLRQLVDEAHFTVDSFVDTGDVMTITVDEIQTGTWHLVDLVLGSSPPNFYKVLATDTVADVAAGLVAAINAGVDNTAVTAADTGNGTFTITADVVNIPFAVALSRTTVSPLTITLLSQFLAQPGMSVVGLYGVQLSNHQYAMTTASTDDVASIAARFVSVIDLNNGGPVALGIDAVDDTAGAFHVDLTTATRQDLYVLNITSNITLVIDGVTAGTALGRGTIVYHTPSADETIADSLFEANEVDNDFYAVGSLNVDDVSVTALATAISTESKIHGYITESTNVTDASVTIDIMSTLKAANFNRTFGTFRKIKGTFFEFAWMGDRLPTDPGTSTWKFGDLIGQTLDDLASSEENAVLGKNGNVYSPGGVGGTAESTMASGRFIDIQRSVDFIESELNAAHATELKKAPKIPYPTGPAFVEGILSNKMQEFNDSDVLGPLLDSEAGELYRVTVPPASEQTEADRVARIIRGAVVEGQIAGAVHKIFGVVNLAV